MRHIRELFKNDDALATIGCGLAGKRKYTSSKINRDKTYTSHHYRSFLIPL